MVLSFKFFGHGFGVPLEYSDRFRSLDECGPSDLAFATMAIGIPCFEVVYLDFEE